MTSVHNLQQQLELKWKPRNNSIWLVRFIRKKRWQLNKPYYHWFQMWIFYIVNSKKLLAFFPIALYTSGNVSWTAKKLSSVNSLYWGERSYTENSLLMWTPFGYKFWICIWTPLNTFQSARTKQAKTWQLMARNKLYSKCWKRLEEWHLSLEAQEILRSFTE